MHQNRKQHTQQCYLHPQFFTCQHVMVMCYYLTQLTFVRENPFTLVRSGTASSSVHEGGVQSLCFRYTIIYLFINFIRSINFIRNLSMAFQCFTLELLVYLESLHFAKATSCLVQCIWHTSCSYSTSICQLCNFPSSILTYFRVDSNGVFSVSILRCLNLRSTFSNIMRLT